MIVSVVRIESLYNKRDRFFDPVPPGFNTNLSEYQYSYLSGKNKRWRQDISKSIQCCDTNDDSKK